VPTLSQFFGITVRMYYDDHGCPHFHAYYGDDNATIAIETLDILEGRLPRRALGLLLEWAVEHREELRANWIAAEEHQPLRAIAPLE
jgi:hypothetical protein